MTAYSKSKEKLRPITLIWDDLQILYLSFSDQQIFMYDFNISIGFELDSKVIGTPTYQQYFCKTKNPDPVESGFLWRKATTPESFREDSQITAVFCKTKNPASYETGFL